MAYEVLKYAGTDLRTVGLYLLSAEGIAGAPPVRGGNILIPYQTGQRWTNKFYDERHIVLNGDLGSVVSRAALQTKLDQLKALFPIAAGEQKLEVQRADGTYRYCMCEVRNHLGLQHVLFPTRWTPFSIELIASDPYWYSSALEGSQARPPWALDTGVLFDDGAYWFDQTSQSFAQLLSGPTVWVEASNAGSAPVRKIVLTLSGPMISPKITNMRNGLSLQLLRTFVQTDVVVIDCGTQQITLNSAIFPSGGVVALGGAGNQSDWLRLEPGENTLKIELGTSVPVNYQALYSAAYL
jgi:hypothetical protein